MRQLKKIIVGHDLRRGGAIALRSAVVLAQKCGAALRLVHVVEPHHAYQRLSHPLTAPYPIEAIAQKAGAALQNLIACSALKPLQVDYEVRRGKPFVELIIARRAWLADLIVVGGVHEGEAHLLGSTSARVVRKALVPVMVTKKHLSPGAKTFLVPTDFSACAKRAAEEALVLAETFCARLVFLHVVDLYPVYAYGSADNPELAAPIPQPAPGEIENQWRAFFSGLPLGNVDWEQRTEEGRAGSEISRQAERTHADLIVMGTHGRTSLAYMLLGSVAEKVVRTVSCPVLTIRPDAFQFEMP